VVASKDLIRQIKEIKALMKNNTMRYNTIEEFNVDSKAEYTA